MAPRKNQSPRLYQSNTGSKLDETRVVSRYPVSVPRESHGMV